jgi:transposase
MVFDNQINLLYIYSPSLTLPVFCRLFPGNLREVKGIRLTLKESCVQDAIMIADKGFYSSENIAFLQQQNLKYIIPLRRDNAIISYHLMSKTSSNYFKYYD